MAFVPAVSFVAAVMLLDPRMALASSAALRFTAFYQFVVLGRTRPAKTLDSDVRMHVGAAIRPRPAPARVADEQRV